MLIFDIIRIFNDFVSKAIKPPGITYPPSGCFQRSCWELAVVDGHILHALCVPESGVRTDLKENMLDLSRCVGVNEGGVVWQDEGFYIAVVDGVYITHADQYREPAHTALEAKCPGSRRGERFQCEIDLSERIWIDNAQLGCFEHRANYSDPLPPV